MKKNEIDPDIAVRFPDEQGDGYEVQGGVDPWGDKLGEGGLVVKRDPWNDKIGEYTGCSMKVNIQEKIIQKVVIQKELPQELPQVLQNVWDRCPDLQEYFPEPADLNCSYELVRNFYTWANIFGERDFSEIREYIEKNGYFEGGDRKISPKRNWGG